MGDKEVKKDTGPNVIERILKDRGEMPQETMTFEEYLREVFLFNPKKYSRGAHKYLVDAIESYGTEPGLKFFEGKIFGADRQVRELYELLKSASLGNDVKRRIILLVGPVGTAKSTTVYHLKRLLEEYSRSEEGALYAIDGCPLHEDPLHLLSESARQELRGEYGVVVEGQLCPVCSYRLREEYQGDISKVRVKRIYLSESDRVGIATFAPGDPNTQDLSDIVGSINIYTIQREGKGDPAHPLSWSFTGAAFQANRGIFEFIELFKAKRELLNALLTLAQERQVKPGRFNLIYVDTVILAHTNYTEYNRFSNEPGTEAIRDRTRVVEWRYVLNPYEEERVYRLMIPNLDDYDMDPWSLRYPALLAVLSRLSDPEHKEFPASVRLKIYSGEPVEGLSEYAISSVYKKFEDDGRSGLSPRWVVDQINLIQVKKGYVSTPDLISHFSEILPKVIGEKMASIIRPIAVGRYNDYVKSLLSEVVVSDFESLAQSYFDRYRSMVRSWRSNEKVYVPSTGEWREPDEEFMRSLESLIGITSPSEASVFRTNFLINVGEVAERWEKITWRSHPKLEEAIRALIIKEHKSLLRAALVSRGISDEADRAYERIVQRLVRDHGYSERTAKRLLEYAGELVTYT